MYTWYFKVINSSNLKVQIISQIKVYKKSYFFSIFSHAKRISGLSVPFHFLLLFPPFILSSVCFCFMSLIFSNFPALFHPCSFPPFSFPWFLSSTFACPDKTLVIKIQCRKSFFLFLFCHFVCSSSLDYKHRYIAVWWQDFRMLGSVGSLVWRYHPHSVTHWWPELSNMGTGAVLNFTPLAYLHSYLHPQWSHPSFRAQRMRKATSPTGFWSIQLAFLCLFPGVFKLHCWFSPTNTELQGGHVLFHSPSSISLLPNFLSSVVCREQISSSSGMSA